MNITRPDVPRSYDVEDLREHLFGLGFRGEFFDDGRWRAMTSSCAPSRLCNAWFWRDR